jgi:hypothetical protein
MRALLSDEGMRNNNIPPGRVAHKMGMWRPARPWGLRMGMLLAVGAMCCADLEQSHAYRYVRAHERMAPFSAGRYGADDEPLSLSAPSYCQRHGIAAEHASPSPPHGLSARLPWTSQDIEARGSPASKKGSVTKPPVYGADSQPSGVQDSVPRKRIKPWRGSVSAEQTAELNVGKPAVSVRLKDAKPLSKPPLPRREVPPTCSSLPQRSVGGIQSVFLVTREILRKRRSASRLKMSAEVVDGRRSEAANTGAVKEATSQGLGPRKLEEKRHYAAEAVKEQDPCVTVRFWTCTQFCCLSERARDLWAQIIWGDWWPVCPDK